MNPIWNRLSVCTLHPKMLYDRSIFHALTHHPWDCKQQPKQLLWYTTTLAPFQFFFREILNGISTL